MSSSAIRTAPQPRRAAPPEPPAKSRGPECLAKAVALHLAGKRDEALQELERAVTGGDASPEMYRAIGHIRFELGDYREAARSYQSLTQLKPNYAMGWFNLAVCLE